jgi:hypothetical protein
MIFGIISSVFAGLGYANARESLAIAQQGLALAREAASRATKTPVAS